MTSECQGEHTNCALANGLPNSEANCVSMEESFDWKNILLEANFRAWGIFNFRLRIMDIWKCQARSGATQAKRMKVPVEG